MNIKEWADQHGEIPMTMKQFQEEEKQERSRQKRLEAAKAYNEATRRKRGAVQYTLSLTADELDWLLWEILDGAAYSAEHSLLRSKALDIRLTIEQWHEAVADQGYIPEN